MTRRVNQKALALLVLGIFWGVTLVSHQARAEDEFNKLNDEGQEQMFHFKVPPATQEPEPDYEDHPIHATSPKNVWLDYTYPRVTFNAAYSPSYLSLTQNLEAGSNVLPQFSFTNYAPEVANVGMTADFNAQMPLVLAIGVGHYNASSQTIAPFSVSASSITTVDAVATQYYCTRPGASLLRICPGLGVGLDSFPVMTFSTNSQLALNSFSDMIVRATVKLAYPLGQAVNGSVEAGYDDGVLHGGNSGVHINNHHTIWGGVGFDSPFNGLFGVKSTAWDFLGGISAAGRGTDFKDYNSGSTWGVTALFYSVNLGIRYSN